MIVLQLANLPVQFSYAILFPRCILTLQIDQKMKTERLEMFSDGVFAIAITLLILEIKIPKHEDLVLCGGLYNYLIQLWPAYLAYFVSFFVIGIYWSGHNWLFTFIKRTDHVFNLLALLFLMTIALLPFPTALLGDFIANEEYRNAAVTAYCVGFLLPAPTSLIGLIYATHKHRLVEPNLSKKFIRGQLLKFSVACIFSSIAIALSFHHPLISVGIVAFLCLMFLLPPDKPVYEV